MYVDYEVFPAMVIVDPKLETLCACTCVFMYVSACACVFMCVCVCILVSLATRRRTTKCVPYPENRLLFSNFVELVLSGH